MFNKPATMNVGTLINASAFAATSTLLANILSNWRFDRLVNNILSPFLPTDDVMSNAIYTTVLNAIENAMTGGIWEYLGQGFPVARGFLGINPLWTDAILSGLLVALLSYLFKPMLKANLSEEMTQIVLVFFGNFLSVLLLNL